MAAPAAAQPPPLLVRINESEVKTTMPLPRAIQLVMTIVWSPSESFTTTTAPSTTATIGDLPGSDFPLILWIFFLGMPSILIAAAAGTAYAILSDDGGGRQLISGAGGFCYVAIPILLFVYNAVLLAAMGHLGLFAPRTPVAACEALFKGTCCDGFGLIVVMTSINAGLIGLIRQAWPLPLLLLVAWTCLLGLLVASSVAFWLCILRTYGAGERREKNSCGEAVIDGLAYPYCRLLYQYAVWFHKVAHADTDAAGMKQLDADVAAVV